MLINTDIGKRTKGYNHPVYSYFKLQQIILINDHVDGVSIFRNMNGVCVFLESIIWRTESELWLGFFLRADHSCKQVRRQSPIFVNAP